MALKKIIFNPAASYPLAVLYETYFYSGTDNAVYPLVPILTHSS
jgi:hypothetical protein